MRRDKLLVYVAGPYRDPRGTVFVEENIRRAEEVAKELWKRGYAVICPHANTRHFDGLVPSEEFIAGDLQIVCRCDLVVMLPDWQHSEGAKQEYLEAKDRGVPVVEWSKILQLRQLLQEVPEGVRPLLQP